MRASAFVLHVPAPRVTRLKRSHIFLWYLNASGEEWLTPLLHQQMAGRAGRRGLDRQGHLVYAGFSRDRLHSLLRGRLPAVVGRFPLYPTLALQMETNHMWETLGPQLNDVAMDRMCANPLGKFLEGKQGEVEGYYAHAKVRVFAVAIFACCL